MRFIQEEKRGETPGKLAFLSWWTGNVPVQWVYLMSPYCIIFSYCMFIRVSPLVYPPCHVSPAVAERLGVIGDSEESHWNRSGVILTGFVWRLFTCDGLILCRVTPVSSPYCSLPNKTIQWLKKQSNHVLVNITSSSLMKYFSFFFFIETI